jgi:hypothetical protein
LMISGRVPRTRENMINVAFIPGVIEFSARNDEIYIGVRFAPGLTTTGCITPKFDKFICIGGIFLIYMVLELGMRLWRLRRENPLVRARARVLFGFLSHIVIALRVFLEGEKTEEGQLPLPERQSSISLTSLFFRPVLFLQR